MHIGLALPMMYLNCVENVRFVLKIMLTQLLVLPFTVKLLAQDSSTVLTLVKLMDIPIL